MKILAVNAGSSSLKFQLINMPEESVLTSGLVEKIGSTNAIFTIKVDGVKNTIQTSILNHKVAVNLLLEALVKHNIIKDVNELEAVGHRVVQGGEEFNCSVIITNEVVNKIEALSDLAPLHNPANLIGINTFRELLPNVINVAVFDNAFHSTLDSDAYMYALPYEYYQNYKIRKYGFHGTSHEFVSKETIKLLNKEDSKIVVCHIGNGASLCAVKNGKSVDTTMGLTPLDGIPMGTRSGAIDPGVIEYISNKENKSVSEVTNILNKKSGYLGVSGISNDARDIEKAINEGNNRAKLAFDLQAKSIASYIGSYYVYMQGLDAISFTAGIGENSGLLRALVLDRLSVLGVEYDKELNATTRSTLTKISLPSSKVAVYVIPTNEEIMITRDTYNLARK